MLADITQHQLYLIIISSSSRHYAIEQQNIFCTLVFQSASVAGLTIIKAQQQALNVVCYDMRLPLILTILASSFLSCKTKTENANALTKMQLLISDTTNNRRAKWDLRDINYRSKVEKQIGLRDLKNGADSLEIRLWSEFAFSNFEELYLVKLQDTACLVSYYRVYPRSIDYEDSSRNFQWEPYNDPIVDSFVAKSIVLPKNIFDGLHSDSIWLLKSQSELKIPDNIGFTDCDSYIIQIADKHRYKYLRHHCPNGYYDKTRLPQISSYMSYCWRIITLLRDNNATVRYTYD